MSTNRSNARASLCSFTFADGRRETIRTSHEQSADHISPDPQSPSSQTGADPTPAAPSDASLASE